MVQIYDQKRPKIDHCATEVTTDCSELATQKNQHQPTTTKSSLKLSPKLQLTQHLVVKSAGQHEFKALSLNSDLTQVQEKLATLDHFGMTE